jgi:hypothetical protein
VIERTHRVIAAMKEAATEGKGAVSLDGRLIDAASLRMAENLLAKLEQIDRRSAGDAAVRRPRKSELGRPMSSDGKQDAA